MLIHTFMYLTIYYGNSPTSAAYSEALDIPSNILGLLKAITPLAAFISTFFYGFLLDGTYTKSYIISFFLLTFGCLCYFLALTTNSVILIVLGRIGIGFGGARVITRKYLSIAVTPESREFWGSALVAATALSITGGPGVSSFLEYLPSLDFLFLDIRKYNILSLVFFVAFCIVWALFHIIFKDSEKKSKKKRVLLPCSLPAGTSGMGVSD